ncbi:MAG: thermonuclease family protein [Candidatus Moraniibacteriota bacterium]
MTSNKKFIFFGVIFVFALVTGRNVSLQQADRWFQSFDTLFSSTNQPPSQSDWQRVLRVVDGDTVELENGEKVRYIGMNAPESVKPNWPVECFGHEASDYNKQLVEGKRMRLEKDVSDRDKYGRLLRFVYLEDGTLVNDTLVREGYASVSTFPPDVAKEAQFKQAQQEARDAKRGLWAEAVCNGKK